MIKLKLFRLSLVLLFLVACEDSLSFDCSTVLCAQDAFQVILVDTAGNNLIDNGTFERSEISVLQNGVIVGGVSNIPESDNTILINLETRGTSTFEIRLSETEVDFLSLNLTTNGDSQCCLNFDANSAIYNGEEAVISDGVFQGIEAITIVR